MKREEKKALKLLEKYLTAELDDKDFFTCIQNK